jgi:hypothetical protein
MTTSSRTVRLATRLHRSLLWLVPSEVRRDYGAEMNATFEAAATDARRAGPLAVCRLLFHEILDLAWSRRANRPAGVAYPPAPSVAPGQHQRGEWVQISAWRQASRSLARRPAFFAAAVLTLAFGAGVTTAVFSLVDTVLIKPLPYPDADAFDEAGQPGALRVIGEAVNRQTSGMTEQTAGGDAIGIERRRTNLPSFQVPIRRCIQLDLPCLDETHPGPRRHDLAIRAVIEHHVRSHRLSGLEIGNAKRFRPRHLAILDVGHDRSRHTVAR